MRKKVNIDEMNRAHVEASLKAARQRDGRAFFIGHAEFYCDNSACACREICIHFKEFDGPLPSRLKCPACGTQLKVHGVQTLTEHIEWDDKLARESVNAQRWVRDHGAGLVAIPLSAMLNDELPP